MNKSELVAAIAADTNETQKTVQAVVNSMLGIIIGEVSQGGQVLLVGFGTFEARERKEREGRNPKTGEKMLIPATKVPGFSAGKLFKESVLAGES